MSINFDYFQMWKYYIWSKQLAYNSIWCDFHCDLLRWPKCVKVGHVQSNRTELCRLCSCTSHLRLIVIDGRQERSLLIGSNQWFLQPPIPPPPQSLHSANPPLRHVRHYIPDQVVHIVHVTIQQTVKTHPPPSNYLQLHIANVATHTKKEKNPVK